MLKASRLEYLYLAHFSKPKADRQLYRLIKQCHPAHILEIGIGTLRRSLRMICVAGRYADLQRIEYTAIDPYECRPTSAWPLSLKQAYCLLRATGARIRLLPGDPWEALRRSANMLAAIDLVIISASESMSASHPAWFYLPRLLHEHSVVLRETADADGQVRLETISRAAVLQLARPSTRRKAA